MGYITLPLGGDFRRLLYSKTGKVNRPRDASMERPRRDLTEISKYLFDIVTESIASTIYGNTSCFFDICWKHLFRDIMETSLPTSYGNISSRYNENIANIASRSSGNISSRRYGNISSRSNGNKYIFDILWKQLSLRDHMETSLRALHGGISSRSYGNKSLRNVAEISRRGLLKAVILVVCAPPVFGEARGRTSFQGTCYHASFIHCMRSQIHEFAALVVAP